MGSRQEMPADHEALAGLESTGSSPEPPSEPPSQGPHDQPSVLVCGVLEAERPPSILLCHAHSIVCVPPSPLVTRAPLVGGLGLGGSDPRRGHTSLALGAGWPGGCAFNAPTSEEAVFPGGG